MSNFKKDIEKLYSENFEGFEIKPSNKVWENLEKDLSKGSFTKFNPLKFNVYYLSLVILIITGTLFFVSSKNNENNLTANSLKSSEKFETERNFTNSDISSNDISKKINKNYFTDTIKTEKQQFTDISLTDNLENNQIQQVKEIFGISNALQLNIVKDENNLVQNTVKGACEKFETSDCNGCAPLKINFTNKIENAEKLKWTFGNGLTSNEENPQCIYETSGQYIVCLEYVQDGVSGYFYDTILVYQKPIADFTTILKDKLLPGTEIIFSNESQNATQYKWNFGDSNFSEEFEPTHSYSLFGNYTIKLLAKSSDNCFDSIISDIFVEKEKYEIIFPTAFSPSISGPNGGVYDKNAKNNDVFYPVYSDVVSEYELLIYTRKGILIFKSSDINIGWDGYIQNELAKQDVYMYMVKVKFENSEETVQKGNITVIYK